MAIIADGLENPDWSGVARILNGRSRSSGSSRALGPVKVAAIRRVVFRARSAGAREVHHVVKRAQGGSDFDLDRLVALCLPCHAQTDAPYARGRLVITPLGGGRFSSTIMRGHDKWATRS